MSFKEKKQVRIFKKLLYMALMSCITANSCCLAMNEYSDSSTISNESITEDVSDEFTKCTTIHNDIPTVQFHNGTIILMFKYIKELFLEKLNAWLKTGEPDQSPFVFQTQNTDQAICVTIDKNSICELYAKNINTSPAYVRITLNDNNILNSAIYETIFAYSQKLQCKKLIISAHSFHNIYPLNLNDNAKINHKRIVEKSKNNNEKKPRQKCSENIALQKKERPLILKEISSTIMNNLASWLEDSSNNSFEFCDFIKSDDSLLIRIHITKFIHDYLGRNPNSSYLENSLRALLSATTRITKKCITTQDIDSPLRQHLIQVIRLNKEKLNLNKYKKVIIKTAKIKKEYEL